jgi:hypothetical protein
MPCQLTNFVQSSATRSLLSTRTSFNILKKTGAGGRPVAKPLIRKFAAKAGPVHADPLSGQAGADDNAADPPVAPPAEAVERPSAARGICIAGT